MRHTFHSEQWLPYPVEVVFALFANPQNLPLLMPPWQKTLIETAAFVPPPPSPFSHPASGHRIVGAGTRLTLSFRPFPFSPIRIPWQAEIADFTWNDHFCDLQLRGPFAYWRHCHRVQRQTNPESRANSPGTLLSDDIEYELPLGKLGDLIQRLIIQRQLRTTFAYRQARTSQLLSQ
jgi:ligand-binding SRPBCC domain-containing protein